MNKITFCTNFASLQWQIRLNSVKIVKLANTLLKLLRIFALKYSQILFIILHILLFGCEQQI